MTRDRNWSMQAAIQIGELDLYDLEHERLVNIASMLRQAVDAPVGASFQVALTLGWRDDRRASVRPPRIVRIGDESFELDGPGMHSGSAHLSRDRLRQIVATLGSCSTGVNADLAAGSEADELRLRLRWRDRRDIHGVYDP